MKDEITVVPRYSVERKMRGELRNLAYKTLVHGSTDELRCAIDFIVGEPVWVQVVNNLRRHVASEISERGKLERNNKK
jgi:hypothetical protein